MFVAKQSCYVVIVLYDCMISGQFLDLCSSFDASLSVNSGPVGVQ